MCWVYIDIIDIIATNIPHMKITAVSQWTARFNIQRKPKKCCCFLINPSFELFDHKKNPGLFQDFFKISAKFQDFPGLFSNSWWEPCCLCCQNYLHKNWSLSLSYNVFPEFPLYLCKSTIQLCMEYCCQV